MTKSQETIKKINQLNLRVSQIIGHKYLLGDPIDKERDWSAAAFDLVGLISKMYIVQQDSLEGVTADDLVNNLVKQSREGLLDLVNNQLPELCKQELEITDFPSYVKVLMAVSYPVYLERCKASDVSTDKTVDQVMTMIESGKLTKD